VNLLSEMMREEISCRILGKKDTVSAVRRWQAAKIHGWEFWPVPGLLAHLLDDLLESLDFSHFFKPPTAANFRLADVPYDFSSRSFLPDDRAQLLTEFVDDLHMLSLRGPLAEDKRH